LAPTPPPDRLRRAEAPRGRRTADPRPRCAGAPPATRRRRSRRHPRAASPAAGHHPQEEVSARRRAEPTQGPRAAPRVSAGGRSDRAEAADLRGRVGGMTTAMTPASGRAPRGERVESSAPASWKSLTFVAEMGLGGVRAPMAYPGGTSAAKFEAYV